MKKTIDFDTMRVYCIAIYQVVADLFRVSEKIGVPLSLKVKSADELKTHDDTKSWDGMGRFAKELHDNQWLWDSLPDELRITTVNEQWKIWTKEEAKKDLLRAFHEFGGNNLYDDL